LRTPARDPRRRSFLPTPLRGLRIYISMGIDIIDARTYLPIRIDTGLPATLIMGYVDPQKRTRARANPRSLVKTPLFSMLPVLVNIVWLISPTMCL